ncbi:DNA-processing protein DprA [Actinomadura sp. WMMB 499]|uniref:DNA-processing protein DprA n=1 Tax=Actinomadura sp. WMMB 499 TaxID=1219491 RepID=UPI001245ABC7|nr:DNA-processing protein DprA [Actinomadura sp. WMMB 499]QFG25406.1 DNA-protecting protein DprA [Actinomadura sp. WMMB 499]
MNAERAARAALSAVAEPGDAFLNRLIDHCGAGRALESIRTARPPDGLSVTAKESARLEHWRIRLIAAAPDEDLTVCAELGGRLICPGDPEWPTTLDDLGGERPYALWLRGPADLRRSCLHSVAIVGSRAASSYGVHVAAEFAAELADSGWTVISGGALGIDAAAHRGSMAAEGPTVAVLANGFDVPYPASNEGLFAEMARRSVLVSESPPGTHPHRLRFLVRNRVIAALSRGTVIVEAEARSGALNTASWARRLNRVVMAVPGQVTSRTSVGAHRLLREEGTVLVSRHEEVIEAVGRIGDDLAPAPRTPVLPRDRLEPVTRSVLESFPARGPVGPAQLAAKAGVPMPVVNAKLGILAAGGFVERAHAGWRLTPTAKSSPPNSRASDPAESAPTDA